MVTTKATEMADILTVSAAARELGVSAERVRQLVDTGVLPAERGILGYRLIPADAVAELKERRNAGRTRSGR